MFKVQILNKERWPNIYIGVRLHMAYSKALSEFWFIIFKFIERILQFKRLSNNLNVVFLKPVTTSGFALLLQGEDKANWNYGLGRYFLLFRTILV